MIYRPIEAGEWYNPPWKPLGKPSWARRMRHLQVPGVFEKKLELLEGCLVRNVSAETGEWAADDGSS